MKASTSYANQNNIFKKEKKSKIILKKKNKPDFGPNFALNFVDLKLFYILDLWILILVLICKIRGWAGSVDSTF